MVEYPLYVQQSSIERSLAASPTSAGDMDLLRMFELRTAPTLGTSAVWQIYRDQAISLALNVSNPLLVDEGGPLSYDFHSILS